MLTAPYWPMTGAVAAIIGVGGLSLVIAHTSQVVVMDLHIERRAHPLNGHYTDCFSNADKHFRSRNAAKRTLRALGEESVTPAMIADHADRLSIHRVGGERSSTYRASFRHRDSAYALQFLQTHAARFVGEQRDRAVSVMTAEVQFLEMTLDEQAAEVRHRKEQLRRFERSVEHLSADRRALMRLLQRRVDTDLEREHARALVHRAATTSFVDEPAESESALRAKVGSLSRALTELDREISQKRPTNLRWVDIEREYTSLLRAHGNASDRLRRVQGHLTDSTTQLEIERREAEQRYRVIRPPRLCWRSLAAWRARPGLCCL